MVGVEFAPTSYYFKNNNIKKMKKQFILVKESGSWADEFDLSGYFIFEDENIDKVKKNIIDSVKANCGNFPNELYFGTNEAQYFESEESLLSNLEFSIIDEKDANVLIRILGRNYGVTSVFL